MIKAPTYAQQVDIKSVTPDQLDRHDISIISRQDTQTPAAMEKTAQQLMNMGNQVLEGQLISDAAEREYQEKLRLRQREADSITITNLTTQMMEDWTKRNDEMWNPANPEGHTDRVMGAFRKEAKEKTEGFMGINQDFGLAYGRQIAQLAPQIFHLASSREIHGKIMKQEDQISGTLATATGMAYRDANMEVWEMNRNNMQQMINNTTWGNSDHGRRWKEKINDEMTESLIRGMLYRGSVPEAKKLFDSGKLDQFMSSNTRKELGNAIEAADKHHSSGLRYDLKETMTSNVSQVAETGVAGKQVDRAAVVKQFGEGVLKEYDDNIRVATKQNENKTKIENMPIAQATEYVKSLEPKEATSMNYADEMKLYKHANEVLSKIQAAVKEDPAGYAFTKVQDLKGKFKNDPYIQDIYIQSTKQQNEQLGGLDKLKTGIMNFTMQGKQGINKFSFEDMATSSYIYQKENGFWTGIITPKGVIEADVNYMKTLPPKEFFPFMEQKKQQWGKWFDNYWKDLCTKGKLPTEYKMAAFAQDTPVQNLILNAIRTKESDVTGQLQKQTEYQDARNRVLMKLEPFKRAINQGSASGNVMASGLVDDMADIITRASLMDTTMGVSGNSKKKSVDTIIDQLINDRFYFVDKYMIPKQLPQSLPSGTKLPPFIVSKDTVNKIQGNLAYLKTEKGMNDQAFLPSSSGNEFDAARLRKAYASGAYWVMNKEMDGVYLQYDYPDGGYVSRHAVETADKQRYEFKFKDLIRLEIPKTAIDNSQYTPAPQNPISQSQRVNPRSGVKPADVYAPLYHAPPIRK